MARNPWDDDADVAAMRSMRPRGGGTSWGRILFGVLLVGTFTFAFAFYVPLYRAHSALVGDHSKLRGELESAQSATKQAQSEAKTLREQKDELQAERDKRESAKQSAGAGVRLVLPQLDRSVLRFDWGFPLDPVPQLGITSPWPGDFVLTFRQAFGMPSISIPSATL